MIKFGIAGTGPWGQAVSKAIGGLGFDCQPCDRHGAFQDYDKLLDWADIIWIATRPGTNCDLAARSLKAGRPTVVEKPVAFTGQEVRKLVKLSKDRQVPLIVDYIHLFCANLGLIAKPTESLDIEIGGNGPQRDYSDLWDYGSHAVAIALNHIQSPLISATIGRSIIESSEHESGNHRIKMHFSGGQECDILTGNKFHQKTAKVKSQGLYMAEWNGRMWAYKLQTLISTIARLHLRGEYFTNGDLAVEVTDLLERLHKMLPTP